MLSGVPPNSCWKRSAVHRQVLERCGLAQAVRAAIAATAKQHGGPVNELVSIPYVGCSGRFLGSIVQPCSRHTPTSLRVCDLILLLFVRARFSFFFCVTDVYGVVWVCLRSTHKNLVLRCIEFQCLS